MYCNPFAKLNPISKGNRKFLKNIEKTVVRALQLSEILKLSVKPSTGF